MENEIAQGRVLAGKYRVERVIGRGGMGVVVAAHHLQLDERVAIKFLLPEAVANAEVVGRFVREARAAVRIKSEHVARVSDVGTLEGGEPYMVMEYLEGSDLAGWLQQHGALPIEQAVEFVLQASEAIAEAHALGIVHRDLKPANLFVVRRADGLWSVKVLDFGISKVTALGASGPDANFTRTTAVMGSPLYMPPEQMAASKAVDARADIWALGIILYELMANRAPFAGDTLPEVCMKIAVETPRSIRDFRPDVSQALEAVLLRCLEKDRERRYANVAELAQALLNFGPKRARSSVERITRTIEAAGLSVSAPLLSSERNERTIPILAGPSASAPPVSSERNGSNEVAPATAGSGTEAPWGRTTSVSRKSGRTALAVGALLVVGSVGGALGARRWLSAPAAEPNAPVAPVISAAPRMPATALSAPEPAVVPAASAPAAPSVSATSTASKSTPPPLKNVVRPAPATRQIAASAVLAPVAKPTKKPDIFDDR